MLLKQEIGMQWKLKLHLFFDDGSDKEAVIDKDDYLLVKFRRNENTYCRAGYVVDVNPVMLNTQPISFSGVVTLDFSGRFRASRIDIQAKDILDFRIITKEQMGNLGSDFIIDDAMFDNSTALPGVSVEGEETEDEIGGIDIAGVDSAGAIPVED